MAQGIASGFIEGRLHATLRPSGSRTVAAPWHEAERGGCRLCHPFQTLACSGETQRVTRVQPPARRGQGPDLPFDA